MNIETILTRPSVRGFEFRIGLEAYAHKVGSALGLSRVSVIWCAKTRIAGMNNHGDLYLSGVPDEATVNRALVAKYAAYVVHELLHHKYTDFYTRGKNDYIKTLHNAIEDGWIENTGIQSGLLGNIGPLLGEMIDTMTREALDTVQDWNDPRQYPYILAVHCRAHAKVKCPTNPKLAPIFDFAARRCLSATSSADTLAIAEWVYDQLQQASKQKPKDEPKGDPRRGKPKKDKDEDGPSKPSDGPTSPDQGDDGGEGADEANKPPKPQPVKSPVDVEPVEVEPKLSEGGLMGDYSSDTILKDGWHFGEYVRPGVVNAPVPAKLRYEVKRLFDNSGLSDFNRNRKAGMINVHALPSVATGNDRVFKRRLDVEGVDSAVVICLDVSGSMFDTEYGRQPRIDPAIMVCRALLETLDAAGVKTSVVTFGTGVSVAKGFNKNVKLANRQLAQVRGGGGTSDYTALRFCHQLAVQRPENRKIVFVITDGHGQPNAVRQQVASGKAMGVTTIGIGIKSDVAWIYGQAVQVDDLADLGNASFKQIKLAA